MWAYDFVQIMTWKGRAVGLPAVIDKYPRYTWPTGQDVVSGSRM